MALAKCPRCGKMFNKTSTVKLCTACLPLEEKDYDIVREVIATNPNLNVEQASEESGVAIEVVQRMLEEGLIESQTLAKIEQIQCGRCGKPAISRSKRLCQECLTKLNAEVAIAQLNMKKSPLPKKEVQVDKTGMNVRRTLDLKKRK